MPPDANSITWLLVSLLQKRELPWPTLSLVADTITADARASRYSAWRKKNWSEDQWLTFLEEGKQLRDESEAAVEKFLGDNIVAEFNVSLDRIRLGLIEADSGGDNEDPYSVSAGTPKPADVRSIAWLLRMFMLRTNAVHPTRLLINRLREADARVFALSAPAGEGGTVVQTDAYDRLYRECELGIAAFFEDSDRAGLISRLEIILQQLTAMAPP